MCPGGEEPKGTCTRSSACPQRGYSCNVHNLCCPETGTFGLPDFREPLRIFCLIPPSSMTDAGIGMQAPFHGCRITGSRGTCAHRTSSAALRQGSAALPCDAEKRRVGLPGRCPRPPPAASPAAARPATSAPSSASAAWTTASAPRPSPAPPPSPPPPPSTMACTRHSLDKPR